LLFEFKIVAVTIVRENVKDEMVRRRRNSKKFLMVVF
jgi:hypothetical protein